MARRLQLGAKKETSTLNPKLSTLHQLLDFAHQFTVLEWQLSDDRQARIARRDELGGVNHELLR